MGLHNRLILRMQLHGQTLKQEKCVKNQSDNGISISWEKRKCDRGDLTFARDKAGRDASIRRRQCARTLL